MKYSSIQIVEACKDIKAGEEYLVSYGKDYKKLYLAGAECSSQQQLVKEIKLALLLLKERENIFIEC